MGAIERVRKAGSTAAPGIGSRVARDVLGVAFALGLTTGALAQTPLPYLPDQELQGCLMDQAMANGWQYAEDVTTLSCVDRGVVDVAGLDQLPNLAELDLSDNQIETAWPLGALFGLTTLRLSGNAGIDFGELVPIIDQNAGLVRIGLADIRIGEYLPWFQIPRAQIVELDLANTGLMELWGIEEYLGIEVLDLSGNDIENLWPLGGGWLGPLVSLRELDLSGNRIVDVAPLSSFTGLTALRLSGNDGVDFGQLLGIIDQNQNLVRIGLADIRIGEYLPWFQIQRQQVLELDLANTGLMALWGIEEYSALEVLDVAGNGIEVLYPFSAGPFGPLASLRALDLSDNRVVDVSPLAGLTALTTLRLSGNAGVDFNQLQPILDQNQGLTRIGLADIELGQYLPWLQIPRGQVVELDLANTGLMALWGVEEYATLEILDVSGNDIADLTALGGAYYGPRETLRELDLSDNRIEDVTALHGLARLETLRVSGNAGIDFGQLQPVIDQNQGLIRIGLGGIPIGPYLPWFTIRRDRVVELDLSNTGLMELSGIEEYAALEVLDASRNAIGNLDPLGYGGYQVTLESLRVLDLSDNQVADVMPLSGFTRLETLRLSGNGAVDFGQLLPVIEQNKGLTRIGLGGVRIGSYLPWFDIARERVVELDVSDTGIMALWGLEEYAALESLDASGNGIEDLMPLAAGYYYGYGTPPPLTELDLSDNRIVDIGPLASFTGLATLRLSGNEGIDFAQLQPVINQNQGLTRLGLGDIVLGPYLPWLEIRRDRVLELDVGNTGLEMLWGIEEYSSLEILDASDNRIGDLTPLDAGYGYGFGQQQPLRELDLSNNQIVDVWPLQNTTTLVTLRLSGNAGIDFGQVVPIIDQNQGLTRLGLSDIPIGPYLPWLGPQQERIVELDVANTGLVALWGIEMFTALEALDASRNYMSDVVALSTPYGSPLERLRRLDLSDNQLFDVQPLGAYYWLTELRLSGNPGIDFGQALGVIQQNQGLTRIGLRDIYIGPYLPWFDIPRARVVELDLENTGLMALWGIEEYVGLEVLDVSGNSIYELMPLGGGYFGPMNALRELDLADNAITDIAPLFALPGLQLVILVGNDGVPCFQVYDLQSILGPGAVTPPQTCP